MHRTRVTAVSTIRLTVSKRQAGDGFACLRSHIAARPLRAQPICMVEVCGCSCIGPQMTPPSIDLLPVDSPRRGQLRQLVSRQIVEVVQSEPAAGLAVAATLRIVSIAGNVAGTGASSHPNQPVLRVVGVVVCAVERHVSGRIVRYATADAIISVERVTHIVATPAGYFLLPAVPKSIISVGVAPST